MRQQATLGQLGGRAHGSPFEAHTPGIPRVAIKRLALARPQPEGT
jgi:hypothetical protein